MKTEKAKAAFLEAKQGLSPRTMEHYQRALSYLELEFEELPGKPDLLRGLLNKVSTVWMRHGYWVAWCVFFKWCEVEYAFENPMVGVVKPKLPEVEMRTLDEDELARVWYATVSIRDKCVIALALDSGIRASEFERLRVSDVGQDTIRVWGKGNKQLSVPLSAETRQLLQVLIDQDGARGGDAPLFLGESGKPLDRFGVYRLVRRCMDRAGIKGPKKGPHCLRHSLGRHHIASGGNAFTLQRIMRHTDIETTQKYVHLSLDEVIRAHRDHSPLRGLLSSMKFEEPANSQVAGPGVPEIEEREPGCNHGEVEVMAGRLEEREPGCNHGEPEVMAGWLEELTRAHNVIAQRQAYLAIHFEDKIELIERLLDSHWHKADGSLLFPPDVAEFACSEVERLKREVKEHLT